jgi:anthranilate synthase component 1
MKARDSFGESVLLESSDYRGNENSLSFICAEPLATFRVQNGAISIREFVGTSQKEIPASETDPLMALETFTRSFSIDGPDEVRPFSGFFGFLSFDSIPYFDNVRWSARDARPGAIPEIQYSFYRFMVVINHFNDEMVLIEHCPAGEASQLERLQTLVLSRNFPEHQFHSDNQEESNLSDQGFMDLVKTGKYHCKRGDVFQIVFSRQYSQSFSGDEFKVYRALRHVNPSPYLFYFDFGTFRVFGSSPESQLVVRNNHAEINPIAGTVKRTGNDQEDLALANSLAADPKENAEHTMLVDLARNDLGRHTSGVTVVQLKDIQFFSHVIHLVSKVRGKLQPDSSPLRILADTFPAGTLSGAPKHKAVGLIREYENQARGLYGGAIGYIGIDGSINHAIMIRSFVSKNQVLYYQAGAGIVMDSRPENELQEVNNKLSALKKAIQLANEK